MKKRLVHLFIIICSLHHLVSASSTVTSKFHNTTKFPVLLKSFHDEHARPIEKKVIEPDQLFHSKITAQSTVHYEIKPFINTQFLSVSTGAKNIVYTPGSRSKFALQPATLAQKDANDSFLSVAPTMSLTNATTFPIAITVILKDAGTTTPTLKPYLATDLQPDTTLAQAINSTRLPIGASYSIDDQTTGVTISCAIEKYDSKNIPLALVKNEYNIGYEHGKLYMTPHNRNQLTH